jgi:PH (Pleckstrin Homology) domain-containing protein/zinc ribbon protein
MDNTPQDLTRILGPNEQVELYIPQKIYHPRINIEGVVITNERIIFRHPHDAGLKKDYTDYNYQDISNVILDKGILRSTIKLTLRFGGEAFDLKDLPNSDAERAYGLVRENLVRYQSPFTAPAAGVPPMQQQSQEMKCPKCGSSVPQGQRFCGNCGAQL